MIQITRRRLFGLAGALLAVAAVPAGEAMAAPIDPTPPVDTFKLVRAGSVTVVTDSTGANVYIKAGSAEIGEASAAQWSALTTALGRLEVKDEQQVAHYDGAVWSYDEWGA